MNKKALVMEFLLAVTVLPVTLVWKFGIWNVVDFSVLGSINECQNITVRARFIDYIIWF